MTRFLERRFSVASTTPDPKPDECAHTTIIRIRASSTGLELLGDCWHCKAHLVSTSGEPAGPWVIRPTPPPFVGTFSRISSGE